MEKLRTLSFFMYIIHICLFVGPAATTTNVTGNVTKNVSTTPQFSLDRRLYSPIDDTHGYDYGYMNFDLIEDYYLTITYDKSLGKNTEDECLVECVLNDACNAVRILQTIVVEKEEEYEYECAMYQKTIHDYSPRGMYYKPGAKYYLLHTACTPNPCTTKEEGFVCIPDIEERTYKCEKDPLDGKNITIKGDRTKKYIYVPQDGNTLVRNETKLPGSNFTLEYHTWNQISLQTSDGRFIYYDSSTITVGVNPPFQSRLFFVYQSPSSKVFVISTVDHKVLIEGLSNPSHFYVTANNHGYRNFHFEEL